MDPHADRLLQRSSVLRRGKYDRLTPASPPIDRELSSLVRRFAERPDSSPRAINLSRDPWTDILVAPIQDRSISASSKPVAIAYLSGDRWSTADRCGQLVDLFGLLPSESRLAWAMAQGMSIAEAAEDLGITVETARNYSKKIYAKTGARGQSELVRNILTSVLALA
jgi:DNA-binding CsgD family transcriptional regulator